MEYPVQNFKLLTHNTTAICYSLQPTWWQ